MAEKQDRPIRLPKRGGHTGAKPASAMRPPVRTAAAGYGKAPRTEVQLAPTAD
jgi:hypothetical protein